MASDTKPHRVIHFSLGNRLLPHVVMTDRTVDSGADVRSVIESDVCSRWKTIDALPRNVLAPCAVGSDLFDFRFVRGNHLMTGHAEIDVRDSGVRALIDADVAIRALHAVAEVHFVRVSNRLDGFRAEVKKFPQGIGNGGMRWGENVRAWRSGQPLGSLSAHSPPHHPSQHDHADCSCDPRILARPKPGPKNTPSLGR